LDLVFPLSRFSFFAIGGKVAGVGRDMEFCGSGGRSFVGSGGTGGWEERWGDGMDSESSNSERRLILLRDRSLESRESFGLLTSTEFVELILGATPFEDSASSVECLLYSEIVNVLWDASDGLEPRKRLTELPGIEIKEVNDAFGENPKDLVAESFSGKADFGGGVGCEIENKKYKSTPEKRSSE